MVRDSTWVRNGIDRFVLARMESEGIAPSPEASRSTLVRRLSLDLTGLPPNPDQALGFVNDDSPEAYSRLVEGLLASPHFGERQAQDWFDLISRGSPTRPVMRQTARATSGHTATG